MTELNYTGKSYIGGEWVEGAGEIFESHDPGTGEVVWSGREVTAEQVSQAIESAHAAQKAWVKKPVEERSILLKSFEKQLSENKERIALAISSEMGKVYWEALTEAGAMIGKVALSLKSFSERTTEVSSEMPGGQAVTRYKPHGVVAVFSPFNFPGHLANGHIVPALLAGNAVVLKPSELTPGVSELVLSLWEKAGLPAGLINMVQGARSVGEALSQHKDINGIFFTGSSQVGCLLHKQFAGRPEKILALEMGGNNPLIAHQVKDKKAAAYNILQSSYITSGQRCTCARRLILVNSPEADELVAEVAGLVENLSVGHHAERPEPFMGPVVSVQSAAKILESYDELVKKGAKVIVPMSRLKEGTALLKPGLIDVTDVKDREDKEIFGPLAQIIRVADFDAAIKEANKTSYGLSSAILTDDSKLYEKFLHEIKAGLVNWNKPTTGASGSAPFGGVGLSGNHRPSAYFAADYCAYPVASVESAELSMPEKVLPGVKVA
jgi:succinylglutamic semialdehyde dehydrogenase